MSGNKSSIDLLNVDYDDVLHLYRGWRRSEGLLRDKNRELNTFRARVKSLQESHIPHVSHDCNTDRHKSDDDGDSDSDGRKQLWN